MRLLERFRCVLNVRLNRPLTGRTWHAEKKPQKTREKNAAKASAAHFARRVCETDRGSSWFWADLSKNVAYHSPVAGDRGRE
jgi:hypothetical protein